MIASSIHRKAYESFNSSSSSRKSIPPWCSSGKLVERRKLSPNWEIQSTYPVRENIYEYLYDGENLKCRNKRQNNKTNKRKCYRKKTKLIWLVLLFIAGIMGILWKLYPTTTHEFSKMFTMTKWLPNDWEYLSASEECCHKMRHLALELSRAERILRNTFRLRMAGMSTSRLNWAEPKTTNSQYIPGATATKGSGTEEWGGRVSLWGVVPLWRAAPPPATVLTLRRPTPADCWPFSGFTGELHILLTRTQRVDYISIEHVRPDTANSAPKSFIVYGILPNNTEVEVIKSAYHHNGPAKQYFSVNIDAPVNGVIFSVLNNHGNLKYTCIYRVHLYGSSEINSIDD